VDVLPSDLRTQLFDWHRNGVVFSISRCASDVFVVPIALTDALDLSRYSSSESDEDEAEASATSGYFRVAARCLVVAVFICSA
jgi:hypothetical protein